MLVRIANREDPHQTASSEQSDPGLRRLSGPFSTVCIELRIGRFWKWSGPPKMADHSTQVR